MDIRFAHSEGHTSLCYEESGRYLVTCGTDGDFRIWDGIDDEDPKSHHIGDCSYAIALKEGKVYVSTDSNKVECYSFPDGASQGMVSRFTSTVNHIDCSRKQQFLACGAADFMVKVTNLTDNSEKVFSGHEAPILSVSLDPNCQILATSSCDGNVKVWNMETTQCLKTWTLLPKSNDFSNSKTLGRISWHPHNGKFLAVPVNKEIHIYSKDHWTKEQTTVTIASFSPCGLYLLAACTDGKIIVWNFENGSVLKRQDHDSKLPITDIAWRPQGAKEVAFADNQGQIGIVKYEMDLKPSEKKQDMDDLYADLPEDEYDDDIDLDKVKGSSLIDDEAESDGDDDDEAPKTFKSKSRISKIEDDDEENSTGIDLGKIKAAYEPKIFGTSEDSQVAGQDKGAKPVAPAPRTVVVEKVMANVQQESFQPSSTPAHFQHRYMLWNSVGLVRCYNTEEENSIDVEFHDTSVHHAIHIHNIMGHTMAALSEEALVLASPGDEEQPSKLVCMHFGTWDSTKEWTVDIPEGEKIMSIATGQGWVCMVTDKQFLRLYTVSGLQLNVISILGPVVCTAAMDNTLLVVFHQSAGLANEQHLAITKFTVQKNSLSCSQPYPLPLSTKSTLSWLGFTDEGTACSADSSGVVRLSTLKTGSFWSPIACLEDRNKGKSDHYFVIGLSEIQQQIRCILCKGTHYPATLPRPSLSVVPFQMPFCELTTDKGNNEEKLCRQLMLKTLLMKLNGEDFQVDNEIDACQEKCKNLLLTIFALSVNANREFRAMEVAERMPTSDVVQGAIRYASTKKCLALAQRLGEVAHAKQEEEMFHFADEMEVEEEEQEEVTVPLRPRLSLNNITEDHVIQPKQMMGKVRRSSAVLSNHRSNLSMDSDDTNSRENETPRQNSDDGDDNADSNCDSIPSTPLESKKNPFKVSSQKRVSSNGLDAVLQVSLESKAAKVAPQPIKKVTKKKTNQNGVSPGSKSQEKSTSSKKASAFQLYLEEVKESLKEEYPELDEADIVKKAVSDFKNLDSKEKQIWQDKISSANHPEAEATKKRKANDNTLQLGNEQTKKPKQITKVVSEKTSAKISQFMFSKKD